MDISKVIERLMVIKDQYGDVDVMADMLSITEIHVIENYENNLGEPIGDVVDME